MSTLLCCPFCGSADVEDDYSMVQATLGGNEHQSGWVDCNACGATGPVIHAKNEEIPDISNAVADVWNKARRAT